MGNTNFKKEVTPLIGESGLHIIGDIGLFIKKGTKSWTYKLRQTFKT